MITFWFQSALLEDQGKLIARTCHFAPPEMILF